MENTSTIQRKNVIIIGSGIGGIVTAANLARKGHHVKVFEKNPFPGGRCGRYVKEGHRFDMGATFLMMPGVYDNTFTSLGKKLTDEVKLHRIDPVYKIKFTGDREIRYTSDLAELQKQLEKLETGSYGRFLKLMDKGFGIYERSMPLIDRNYFSLFDVTLLKYPFLLFRYKAFHNHYNVVSRYFKSRELRTFFTFQNLYLGQNPYAASGMYLFLPFMELADGVYFPEGGMHRIAERLLEIAQENNAELLLESPVSKIEIDNRKVTGVTLRDGSFHPADIVVSNADLPYVYNHLLPAGKKARRLNRLKYSCSAVVFHWGIDKVFPQLEQHTVFVSDKHKESCEAIFLEKSHPDEPSIYVHSPVRSDQSAAPENQDSITAIIHSGNLDENVEYDWNGIKERAREAILSRFEKEGLTNFREHIKFELCFTPDSWKSTFNLTRGGTFGSLGHPISQMGFLRPANYHKKYRNLFFVGGSTQPGSGMPLALISAKLVTERIERTLSHQ